MTERVIDFRVKNPNNGIRLDVWTNQNAVQFYTGNFLDMVKPSNNETYTIHTGFCLETQNFPDAVNKVKTQPERHL